MNFLASDFILIDNSENRKMTTRNAIETRFSLLCNNIQVDTQRPHSELVRSGMMATLKPHKKYTRAVCACCLLMYFILFFKKIYSKTNDAIR